MEKKKKWEREYEKYLTSTELNDRLEELEEKIKAVKPRKRTVDFGDGIKVAVEKNFKYEVRHISKEEYDEYKKLTTIKTNLPKVKNILELRGKLGEDLKELKAEIESRELLSKYDKTIELLEVEMKKLDDEKSKLENELRTPNLQTEKKAELQAKLAQNQKMRQHNNVKFGDCHEEKGKINQKAERSKFKDNSVEDLKSKATMLEQRRSMCNYACNRLMQGYSWKSIEVALDKFENEKLTARGEEAAKMKQNREAAKVVNEKGETSKEKLSEKAALKSEEEKEENAIANLTRWQKVKNWTKSLWGKIKEPHVEENSQEQSEEAKLDNGEGKTTFWQKVKNWFKGEEPETQSGDQGKDDSEKEAEPKTPEKESTKEDSFRQYLRDVAEKGMNGVEQENAEAEKAAKEARMQAARKKLEANRAGKDTGATITKLDKELYGQNNDER